ncbi:MAG: type II toxin-antitoxin system VapC family toxin [Blastocatellia bacterium]
MKLLLDTHTFIWFVFNAPELPQATRDLLEEPSSELYFSHASIWEMAIKVSIGKLHFAANVADLATTQAQKDDIELLPIQLPHLKLIESLPLHHKDPFDRLLIAQTLVEGFAIVSIDAAFDAYGVNRIWLT